MKRIWFYAPWTMTEPLKLGVTRAADEFNRRTTCLHLSILGVFVYAHEDDRWYDWMWDAVQRKLREEDPAC